MVCSLSLMTLGCGQSSPDTGALEITPNPYACDADAEPTPTASCIESFEPGDGAGFGSDRYPDVIFGEPLGNGGTSGGTDVLSLGSGGEITIGFGGNAIVDGPGVDFIVFENPFILNGGSAVFSELAEVSVSLDGQTWFTYSCLKDALPPKGCAGYGPVFANGDLGFSSTDPATAGGDQFDLAELGVKEARFVRIRDLEGQGGAPTAGFDLDTVSIVNAKVP